MVFLSSIIIIITFLTSLLKIFLFLFKFNNIFIKILLIFLCILAIWHMYLYPYKYKNTLSKLHNLKYNQYLSYKINDENELDIIICILFLYIYIFIFFLFKLHMHNMTKIFDINIYITEFKVYYEMTSLLNISLNILLIACVIVLYILLIFFLNTFIRKCILKLYLYFFINFSNRKYRLITLQLLLMDSPIIKLKIKYLPGDDESFSSALNYFIYVHLEGFYPIIHRIIFLFIILYDIFYNNLVLTHMYKILPFIFIYEFWIKFTTFLKGLNTNFDEIVAKLLYTPVTEIDIDKECLYLDGEPCERKIIKDVLVNYVRNGFIDKFYLPENPIIPGIRLISNYWKNLILKRIFKGSLTDAVCFLMLLIYYIF